MSSVAADLLELVQPGQWRRGDCCRRLGGLGLGRGDQLQGVLEVGRVVAGDEHVDGAHAGVAVEVVGKVDRRGVEEAALVVAGTQHVVGVDLRVGRRVARLAYGVAEVEDVVEAQARAVGGQDLHPQPLLLDDTIGPDDRHAIGAADAGTLSDGDAGRLRGRGPIGRVVAVVAHAEVEVIQVRRVGHVEDVDHNAVDATAVAGVVGKRSRLARPQCAFVGGDGVVILRPGRRIVAVEGRVVVENVPVDYPGESICIDGARIGVGVRVVGHTEPPRPVEL